MKKEDINKLSDEKLQEVLKEKGLLN